MGKPDSVSVIGGGVVGLCCAHEAMRRGMRVTVVERGMPGGDGCSLGNAGMVVPSHVTPLAAPGMVGLGLRMLVTPGAPLAMRPRFDLDWLRWGWAFVRSATAAHVRRCAPVLRDFHQLSRNRFEEMAGELDFGFAPKGLLVLCRDEEALADEVAAAEVASGLGVPVERCDRHDVARLERGARTDVVGALFYPHDCHLDPARFVRAIHAELVAGGVEFRWGSTVTGWRWRAGGRVDAVEVSASIDGGEDAIRADAFVLTAGVWSSSLMRELGIRLPLEPGRGYSVTVPAPPEMPEVCALLAGARVAVTPMGEDGLRVGGTMELGTYEGPVHPARIRQILEALGSYYPAFAGADLGELAVWSGLRPCSPDGMPYIGRVGGVANLVVATGHAMMGLSLAPATAVLVGQLLSGEPPSVALGTMSPSRFS
ncbi:FAD-dependent oxidoreductase [soil metagenome]